MSSLFANCAQTCTTKPNADPKVPARATRKRTAKVIYDPDDTPPKAPKATGGRNPPKNPTTTNNTSEGSSSSTDVPEAKRAKLEFEGSINSLDDLIALSKTKADYANINMRSLRRIRVYLEELRDLIGLKSLKETVMQQVLYYLQGLHEDSEDYMHTCIFGGPGTGKTTVAELLGCIFSNLGVLSGKGKFVSARREHMIGQYLGHTAVKTSLVLEASRGGVLFIDEIYSFGSKDGRDSFAKEAIDTINLFLSENKDDFMLIVGGYEKEVEECFFRQNAGLRRRFMWYHKIENYNEDDLSQMFMKQVSDVGWEVTPEVDRAWVADFIKANKDHFKDIGGSVENFLTMVKVQHGRRVFGKPADVRKKITRDDVQSAVQKLKESKAPDSSDKAPFGMYL